MPKPKNMRYRINRQKGNLVAIVMKKRPPPCTKKNVSYRREPVGFEEPHVGYGELDFLRQYPRWLLAWVPFGHR